MSHPRLRACLSLLAAALAAVLACARPAVASVDLYAKAQWGIRKVGAESAWHAGSGKGVTIAIVDSGVDLNHEDLRANIVQGYDVVDGDSKPQDVAGHGTHVAGIAAAVANNGLGIAGVAPQAKIMPVRVCDPDGCSLDAVNAGVHWAVDHGADVVNLSLGSDFVIETLTGGTLTNAVNYAWSKGVVPVIAAGNDGLFRAELSDINALVVTATTPSDELAPYATSIGFAKWGIGAPGGTDEGGTKNMIFSSFWSPKGNHYAYMMGTSMAAPHVAGAAAVLRGLGLTPQQTVDRLLHTAKDLGPQGKDSSYGYGRLDVAAATGQKAASATGAPGSSGQQGSNASGSSANGAPGRDASGSVARHGRRGVVGSVPGRAVSPTVGPTPHATTAATPAGQSTGTAAKDSGPGVLAYIAAGIGAFAVAGGLGVFWMRRSR